MQHAMACARRQRTILDTDIFAEELIIQEASCVGSSV